MTPDEALALLKAVGTPSIVVRHSKVVRDVALKIAAHMPVDLNLVEVGALLHDIGRSKTAGVDHAVAGAKILKEKNIDEKIIHIVERHLGAGIDRSDAVQLGLPPKDYCPKTPEEKIVSYADLLVKIDEEISYHQIHEAYSQKFGPGSKPVLRLEELHKSLFNNQKRISTYG